jgi:MucR family transcriptional regulator, transcriptional regulator of exopolysaccharide biosynthesis
MEDQAQPKDRLTLIANITASYLGQNSIGVDQIEKVVANVTRAMTDAEKTLAGGMAEAEQGAAEEAPQERREPAVSPRSSVKPDCLDCGAKVKTLKRHLQSAHGLDPRAYRERWGLKRDYPMTAPSYSERRSAMARQLGLGRKAGEPAPRRGRRKAAATT